MITLSTILLSGATLVVPSEARVRGTELRLDAIAAVRCEDEPTRARLAAFGLGWAPAPGYTRTFQSWQLARDLATAFPDLVIAVEGATTCRVVPEVETISGERLRAAAEAELRALFAARDATIRAQGTPADVSVPLARVRTELRAALESRDLAGGACSVPVQVWVDDTLYRTLWANFEIETFAERPVLVRDVRRGEPIGADALEMRRFRLAAGDTVAMSPAEIRGAIALHDLAAGTAPGARDVERPRLVEAGETIHITVRKGPIVARTNAVAREGGVFGQRIRIARAGEGREIVARVVARGAVEIDLGSNASSAGGAP